MQENSVQTTTTQTEKLPKKKLVVGWFSFTCCEDSTILFTELLNDNFDSWRELVEFRHLKVLKPIMSYEIWM